MEKQYLELLDKVLTYGEERGDRTGTGTISLFGPQIQCNLSNGFPMITTKKLHWKSIAYELLWMLAGDTNTKALNDVGVTIWDEWADERGELGPVYGAQWRKWKAARWGYEGNAVAVYDAEFKIVDQIADLIERIKTKPEDRRLIVSAWNPADVPAMKLPPCHMMFQCYVSHGKFLSLKMYQRSADLFLGVPFNIVSYALLTHILAQICELKPGSLTISFGDAHIYKNHLDQVKEQLTRDPRALPELWVNPEVKKIDDFRFDDFKVINYDPHPPIKAPVSV